MGATVEACLGRNEVKAVARSGIASPLATGTLVLASDALAIAVSGWLGAQLWSLAYRAGAAEPYLRLWPAIIVFLAAYAMLGLYPGVGLSPVEELRRSVLGASLVYLVASASIFLTKGAEFYSRGVFLTCWIFSVVFVPLGRSALRRLFASRSWWGVPVLVLGAGESGRMVVASLKAQPDLGSSRLPSSTTTEKRTRNTRECPSPVRSRWRRTSDAGFASGMPWWPCPA